jgi:acyl-CoA dehydrogenase
MLLIWIIFFLILMSALGFCRASLPIWSLTLFLGLAAIAVIAQPSIIFMSAFLSLYLIIFGILNIHPLRRFLISDHVLKRYRLLMPSMSDTEKAALESGTVGWEGDLFSGMPDWQKLRDMPVSQLSQEEQGFLEGPVETVCGLINNWDISQTMTIPDEIWHLLKANGFFGMIIPKQYGGKAFSASAHAQVIHKLASVNTSVATIVCVPNSLGPAELILEYGTDKQKSYYLPRLASGEDIPCFGLTSPTAGSDAGAIIDSGIVCREIFQGEEQLCLRLNWNKRYITLSPVATLLGLAFKCYDPDGLLGEQAELGITCALIPTALPGVVTGKRHLPLHAAFPNGPTQGNDVIIPLEWVIGGQKMIGQGWRMLMECLAAGRAISLPSMGVSSAKRCVLAAGAYAMIRRQFNTSIAMFEGIQEALARIAGNAYAITALRQLTLSHLDQGQQPAVASAISKYHVTQLSRQIVIDTMDIHGGKGICMGPNNYLAQYFIESPIAITVEGANILTRSMMIYGQGALRCHPYLLAEMHAANQTNSRQGAIAFDRALMAHIGFMMSNKVRSFCLGVSHGCGSHAPNTTLKRYYQLLTRFSAALAFVSDVTTLLLGAKIKRRESLSARLGDVLSLLYMGSAALKYYEDESLPEELPLVKWTCKDLLYRIQTQLDGLISNLPNIVVRFFMRIIVFPRGKNLQPPSDALTCEVATLITRPGVVRNRFMDGVYMTPNGNNPLADLEDLLPQIMLVAPIEKEISKAYRKGLISGKSLEEQAKSAVSAGLISTEECELLLRVDQLRMKIIHVDEFDDEALREN